MFSKALAKTKDQQVATASDADARIRQTTRTPAVNIHETDQAIIVVADMPGVTQDRVEITIDHDVLTLRGAVSPEVHKGFDLLRREYDIANFERAFTLPAEIENENVSAIVCKGVLTVTLPKKKSVQPRRVAVAAG